MGTTYQCLRAVAWTATELLMLKQNLLLFYTDFVLFSVQYTSKILANDHILFVFLCFTQFFGIGVVFGDYMD